MAKRLFGRRTLYTDIAEITRENVVGVIDSVMSDHLINKWDIEYLYNYYKGEQPILSRVKNIRPEINNIIVENRANEIVSFKEGYLMGEPLQYVNRTGASEATEAVNILNEYMFAEDKSPKDKELANWFFISGTAYRMILPDKMAGELLDDAPFEIYTLDPRETFIVYHNGLGNKPVMGVKYIVRDDQVTVYSVYTKNRYYEIADRKIIKDEPHALGDIPIIEYPANMAKLGAFEIVITILDAINSISSNRLDAIEQFVQSLLVLKGVDIDGEEFKRLREMGGLLVPQEGDVLYLTQELKQSETQTLVDYMYQTVLTICGMPNRNGGLSTSDTGSAVIMRDGWSAAEARAKDTELMFKKSEKQFLKLALKISNQLRNLKLKLSDIEIRFTRRNYENILEKTQVLATLLANDKIHPQLAFEHSGLFIDSEMAYTKSMEYYEQVKGELERELEKFNRLEVLENVHGGEQNKQNDE